MTNNREIAFRKKYFWLNFKALIIEINVFIARFISFSFGTLALWHFGRMIETFQGSGLTAYNVNHERNVLTELNDLLPLRWPVLWPGKIKLRFRYYVIKIRWCNWLYAGKRRNWKETSFMVELVFFLLSLKSRGAIGRGRWPDDSSMTCSCCAGGLRTALGRRHWKMGVHAAGSQLGQLDGRRGPRDSSVAAQGRAHVPPSLPAADRARILRRREGSAPSTPPLSVCGVSFSVTLSRMATRRAESPFPGRSLV